MNGQTPDCDGSVRRIAALMRFPKGVVQFEDCTEKILSTLCLNEANAEKIARLNGVPMAAVVRDLHLIEQQERVVCCEHTGCWRSTAEVVRSVVQRRGARSVFEVIAGVAAEACDSVFRAPCQATITWTLHELDNEGIVHFNGVEVRPVDVCEQCRPIKRIIDQVRESRQRSRRFLDAEKQRRNLDAGNSDHSSSPSNGESNPKPQQLADLRVLLVDDDQMILDSTQRILKFIGVGSVTTTTDPTLVKALLKEHRHNLVISDFSMPQMTGLELARDLVMEQVPMIICSGDDPSAIRAAVVGLKHVKAVFPKPFDFASLRKAIAKATGIESAPDVEDICRGGGF